MNKMCNWKMDFQIFQVILTRGEYDNWDEYYNSIIECQTNNNNIDANLIKSLYFEVYWN